MRRRGGQMVSRRLLPLMVQGSSLRTTARTPAGADSELTSPERRGRRRRRRGRRMRPVSCGPGPSSDRRALGRRKRGAKRSRGPRSKGRRRPGKRGRRRRTPRREMRMQGAMVARNGNASHGWTPKTRSPKEKTRRRARRAALPPGELLLPAAGRALVLAHLRLPWLPLLPEEPRQRKRRHSPRCRRRVSQACLLACRRCLLRRHRCCPAAPAPGCCGLRCVRHPYCLRVFGFPS
mmetsp:Transcript_28318/g.89452  ORF Transcript_28318/g.89452 Transcript_28318/m.89452 type:complete len:235 (-) Transcript_28318:726-1430(-)